MRLQGAQITKLFLDWLQHPGTESDWLELPGFVFPNSPTLKMKYTVPRIDRNHA